MLMAVEPSLLHEYTSFLPLGDHTKSWTSFGATCRLLLPLARATLSVHLSCAPRQLRYAICEPSGDHIGSSLIASPLAIVLLWVPSALMVITFEAGPAEPAA
jgi:hypothetical protein